MSTVAAETKPETMQAAAEGQLIDFTAAAHRAAEETMPAANEVVADQFPDDEDEDEDAAIHWRDVPRYTWLCVTRTREVTVNDQVIKILTLLHRDRTMRSAWTTGIITRAIDDYLADHAALAAARDNPTQKLYIKSLGKTNSKSNPTFTYYNFKLKLF